MQKLKRAKETCICSWYGEGYSPEKPVMVVVSGILTYEDMRPRLEAWIKQFSILFYKAIDGIVWRV